MKLYLNSWCLALILILVGCGPTEEELLLEKEKLRKQKVEKELFEKRVQEEKERLRQLELTRVINYSKYIDEFSRFNKKGYYKKALVVLDSSFFYSRSKTRDSILELKSTLLYKSKKYKDAILLNTQLISKNPQKYYFERAKCYNRLKKRQEAVNDLEKAINLNNTEAEKLYNSINPILRRIAYYVTRCCDGSTSSSKGRGACSRHGGVCNWNDPVYHEYRKY